MTELGLNVTNGATVLLLRWCEPVQCWSAGKKCRAGPPDRAGACIEILYCRDNNNAIILGMMWTLHNFAAVVGEVCI